MSPSQIHVAALFDKRFPGDDALWRLASLRFRQAGLGAEFYAEAPRDLERLLAFRPSLDTLAFVHLYRVIDLLTTEGRARVIEFARGFSNRIDGVHRP